MVAEGVPSEVTTLVQHSSLKRRWDQNQNYNHSLLKLYKDRHGWFWYFLHYLKKNVIFNLMAVENNSIFTNSQNHYLPKLTPIIFFYFLLFLSHANQAQMIWYHWWDSILMIPYYFKKFQFFFKFIKAENFAFFQKIS